jgi:hypothetical protein
MRAHQQQQGNHANSSKQEAIDERQKQEATAAER